VRRAVDAITALLRGERTDLTSVPLDMERVPEFHRRVYEAARAIPPGSTRSYGEIAKQLGEPGSARAVGQALGRNPFAIVVPCHRVLAAGGRSGGFSATGGVTTKLRMLAIEGARANGQGALFGGEGGLGFDPAGRDRPSPRRRAGSRPRHRRRRPVRARAEEGRRASSAPSRRRSSTSS
jgi:methylated-DNA-[protein]-cysteine S-methyltransferase